MPEAEYDEEIEKRFAEAESRLSAHDEFYQHEAFKRRQPSQLDLGPAPRPLPLAATTSEDIRYVREKWDERHKYLPRYKKKDVMEDFKEIERQIDRLEEEHDISALKMSQIAYDEEIEHKFTNAKRRLQVINKFFPLSREENLRGVPELSSFWRDPYSASEYFHCLREEWDERHRFFSRLRRNAMMEKLKDLEDMILVLERAASRETEREWNRAMERNRRREERAGYRSPPPYSER
ncbi:uncharacterized protein LY89DRAFT_736055 [Mollisia scopiformis]|uniref:Uncharacterized protein n=1 Tax=Mollisia scopiformis TaxID=149040 RepID=A0A194X4K4_MOLSC|nr:uncharacterized protein LY89DRAFT_736055 [Mollisia scopiformis]KUJ14994.1 hypothetical protein LY89DRAFT_736055 [Mollisia scopiformis]